MIIVIGGKKVIAIVTARANSKGLPGKNFKKLAGKPTIQYSLEAGIGSQYVDDVLLTSDCTKCINLAADMGIMVPFVRPNHLTGDLVESADVIIHAIKYLSEYNRKYDIFVLLEPTSPLRDSLDIDKALEQIIAIGSKSLVSVCLAENCNPSFLFKLNSQNLLETWNSDKFVAQRRQDVSQAYFLDGSVYISYIDDYLRLKSFIHDDTTYYEVPKWKSFEIDDLTDFICIEAIINNKDNIEKL